MRGWTKTVAAAAGGVVGTAAVAAAVGRVLWQRSTASAIGRLVSGVTGSHAQRFSPEQLEGLPVPVVRYFRFALSAGQAPIRTTRVEQTGEFRTGGFNSPWNPMTAVQYFSTEPPGFVWDAAIRVGPFLSVQVRDSYIRGAGAMQARLASLVRMVDQRDRPELNAGALHRYLAEAIWFPMALLPSQRLTWQAIDDTTARATLTYSATTVSLEFSFSETGAITRAYTPERYREVGGKFRPSPWACAYRSYAPANGMRIPMEGEAEWILPEGRLPYWRGKIRF